MTVHVQCLHMYIQYMYFKYNVFLMLLNIDSVQACMHICVYEYT